MVIATTTTVFSIIVLVSHVQAAQTVGSRSSAQCALYLSTPEKPQRAEAGDTIPLEDLQGLQTKGNSEEQVVTCIKATNFCFALWMEDDTGYQTIIKQGCWKTSGEGECERTECVAERQPTRAAHPNTKFCCCSGDMCNSNVTALPANTSMEDPASVMASDKQPCADPVATVALQEQERQHMILIVGVPLITSCLLVMIAVVVFCYVQYERRKLENSQHLTGDTHLLERASDLPAYKGYSPEHLKLIEVVGQGRYGSVWRGTLREVEVAVKIFPGHYRNYFLNERDVYSLPFMEHPSLLTYFGCDERTGQDGGPELLLVLSYAPLGCLQDFLRHTTPDWPTFCRMSASVSSGLAHLHTDIKRSDITKPCVSHRDLNTRNILVKADLSCCICDLGLSLKTSGSRYFSNGEEQRAETKSINDVGTLRYMAPEVLEGAVNLRDCESALKQIDVYALGLVLWELAVRCADLYATGLEAPAYRLPFEVEIGLHPTFEQMQVLVSRHKARPLLPETWRDNACVRLLRETIEDCWDQDAEARLTALCVDERLRELPVTWERHRGTIYVSGLSPTVNVTSSQVSSTPANNNNSNHNNNNNNNHNGLLHCTLDNRLHLTLPELGPDDMGPHPSRHSTVDKDALDSTVSEGTVETLVTLSPSEPMPDPSCKNAQMASSQQSMPSALQPYQGRNPCLERNLMSLEPEPQLLPNGNTLVDLSAATADETAAESHALLAHDSLQHNAGTTSTALRPATPIPYVQNPVFETDPLSSGTTSGVCPKQPNVPGNRRRPASHVPSRWSWLLGNAMRLRKFSESSSNRRKQHNRSSTGSALLLREVGNKAGTRDAALWEDETKSSNLSRSPLPSSLPQSPPTAPLLIKTKVSLKQGSPVCTKDVSSPLRPRPSSLALGSPDWLKTQRQMRPPSAHIKTPKQHVFSGRFSLYDDRIMSEQLVVMTEEGRETRATSVPGDMNC